MTLPNSDYWYHINDDDDDDDDDDDGDDGDDGGGGGGDDGDDADADADADDDDDDDDDSIDGKVRNTIRKSKKSWSWELVRVGHWTTLWLTPKYFLKIY